MNQSFWFTAKVVNFQMQKHLKEIVHVIFSSLKGQELYNI